MSALYFDTAYLCKLRWSETGSAEVAACAAGATTLVCSVLGRLEFYSVCHRKLREGAVSQRAAHAVCAQFEADLRAGGIQLIPITDAISNRVTSFFLSAPPFLYLRTADALHLATAVESGFDEIFSNDRHLLAAAAHFGLKGSNVIP